MAKAFALSFFFCLFESFLLSVSTDVSRARDGRFGARVVIDAAGDSTWTVGGNVIGATTGLFVSALAFFAFFSLGVDGPASAAGKVFAFFAEFATAFDFFAADLDGAGLVLDGPAGVDGLSSGSANEARFLLCALVEGVDES